MNPLKFFAANDRVKHADDGPGRASNMSLLFGFDVQKRSAAPTSKSR
jgi:hypothetical protein